MRGAPTFDIFIKSFAVNSFFPFLARGSGAVDAAGLVSPAVTLLTWKLVITMAANKTIRGKAKRSDFITDFLQVILDCGKGCRRIYHKRRNDTTFLCAS